MLHTTALAVILLCSGKITTNTGSKKYVNFMLKNITEERLELGLQYGSLMLERENKIKYSAPLDEYGSVVEISLSKRTGNAHYTYLNFGSDKDLKSAGSGWLSCRNL